jgi:tRNA1Val (adenine37-N6)-methyltransferase
MANTYFSFKQFTIWQEQAAMKVTTDACLFGAWVSEHIRVHASLEVGLTSPPRVADVGAGTGLLSLMVRQKNPAVIIEALEIDPLAAEQARQNISRADAVAQINVRTTDATHFSPAVSYHCIVSNPPFYQDDLKAAERRRSWAFHEETLTLSQLLVFIGKNLSSNGYFYLLLPTRREKDLEAMLGTSELRLTDKFYAKTSPQHLPHRLLLAGRRVNEESTLLKQYMDVQEICIKDQSGQYSSAFKELLRDYYLAL